MKVELNVQKFLDAMAASGAQPIETLDPAAARQVLVGAQESAKAPLAPAVVSEKIIDVSGGELNLTIVKPEGASLALPAFMFFHGGGWILGDFPTHERFVRDLVADSGVAAVFVNFTPSPEAHFPVAINQAYEATAWVAKNGSTIGIDGSRLAVVGNSVGGNMAAVVSLMAKQKGGPELRSQILFWPVTDSSFENGSYDQFEEGYYLSRNMMKWFWDAYTTSAEDRNQVYASPLLATIEELQGLPPALVQTAECDVLRDEGEAYARKLDAAGVPVVATRYNGMIHDYGLLNILSEVPSVKAALHQASEELRSRLS